MSPRFVIAMFIAALTWAGTVDTASAAPRGRGAGVRAEGSGRQAQRSKAAGKRKARKKPAVAPVAGGDPGSNPGSNGQADSSDMPAAPAAPTPVPPAKEVAPAPGKPRVYTFGGMDVTGTLKAPQMLFFRARVQQELDTSAPAKRSFLKELERSADAQGL